MDSRRLGEKLGLSEDLIKKACSFSMKAHDKFPGKLYLYEKSQSSNYAIFAFPGLWAVADWYSHKPFGETKVDTRLFPSLRSIGTDEVAVVNAAFSSRFAAILNRTSLSAEVKKALSDGKQIVFTGHSSGGPIAILAAIWCLDNFIRLQTPQKFPFCVTFGCPLIGDRIFSHALRRENWSQYFIHFVMRYDLVPRIMLAPISSIEQFLPTFFAYISPKTRDFKNESVAASTNTPHLFSTVMKNTCLVTSHAACILMGSTNLLLETVSNFIQLSPYRPFGTFIFCTDNGKLILVENPDAILQILFFSSQLISEAEGPEVAKKSFKEHLCYETVIQSSLEMQDMVDFSNLVKLPLSSDSAPDNEAANLNAASIDFGLSTRARLCLRAAGEWAEQKRKNKIKIDGNKDNIKEGLSKIVEYQTKCEVRKVGYYDSFKLQKTTEDFDANVKRLELAGIMDEVVEMLKRHELPDEFEVEKEWVILGTEFRRLVEPLDIANYYRHLKNEDTGPYMNRARPKRYRFTQRWLEHSERKDAGDCLESCFWAEVEELKNIPIENVLGEIQRIQGLENLAYKWFHNNLLGKDIFLDESTFAKWWKSLPLSHRQVSWISISGYLTA